MLSRKNHFHIIVFQLFSLTFFACKDNLDIKNSEIRENNYFQSEYSITQGIGAAYQPLCNIYGQDLNAVFSKHAFWLLPGDDITFDGTSNPLETFVGLKPDNRIISEMWGVLYKIIDNCNFMLDKLDEPQVIEIYKTPGLREANRAELLFIRSWCNFKLWDNWRKAPIQDKRRDLDNYAKFPPTKDFELLDYAINSMEEAAPLAKISWESKFLGRITRDACYGLLVKLYVTRACYNNKSTEDYSRALLAFENISKERLMGFLSVKFSDNFDYRTENNPESLFEYEATGNYEPGSVWLAPSELRITAAFYHYSDGHWSNYQSGIFGPTQKLVQAFDLNDPRKEETFSKHPTTLDNELWWVDPDWKKFKGYQLVKYVNGEKGNLMDDYFQMGSCNNPRLLRLADIKLCAAEAYLALGKSVAALNEVNNIRERARNSVTPASVHPAPLTVLSMDNIMKERFLELAGEDGHRWSDLKRWHAAGYINLADWTAADFGFPDEYNPIFFTFDVNKNLLFPIPREEMENNPLMKASGQNPGYSE